MAVRKPSNKPNWAAALNAQLRFLGSNIRAARKSAGYTQDRLAERLDLSANFIAHLERGSRIPSLGTLVSMSEVFSIPLHDLIRPAGKPVTPPSPATRPLLNRLERVASALPEEALLSLVDLLERTTRPQITRRGKRGRQ